MKDVLLDWGDEISSLNQKLSNFSLRSSMGHITNGSSFLTDPIESISHNDEALGLEFASSMPFVSTLTPAQQMSSQIKPNDFRENGLQPDSYPTTGGLETSSGFGGFHNGLTAPNERTFSSSSNSSNTSFISEGSFKHILRNAPENGYRESNGLLTASTPYRFENNFNGNESFGSRSISSRVDDSFFPVSSYPEHYANEIENPPRRWDYSEKTSLNSLNTTQQSRIHYETPRYMGSPHSDSKMHTGANTVESDLSFLDSMNPSLDLSAKTSGSWFGNSGIWNSPSHSCSNQQQQQPFNMNMFPSKLNAKQSVHLMQILENVLDECKDSGDNARAAQTCILIQTVQQHLVSELDTPSSPNTNANPVTLQDSPVDRAAKYHREVAVTSDAAFTWSGQLPPRIHRNPTYSCKIFLGGVPWDMTESALISAFKPFGNIKIEWPGKEPVPSQPKGYAYVIFEHEKQVKLLLQNCFIDYSNSIAGDWYFKMSSKRFRGKEVQVIPWALSDSNYSKCQAAKIDAKKTIFVGALHGMLNAEGLATIMNDLFGGVIYAGIDTDRHKYPIGSGRVTFSNHKSYMKAVSAAFVEIKTKFKKKVQVDPYLEDATCSVCNLQQGPYFCREWSCFRYFCRTCYQTQHTGEAYRSHRPLMRNASKPPGSLGSVTPASFSPANNRNRGGSSYWNMNNANSNSWNSSSSYGGGFQRRHEYNNGANNTRFSHMR